MRGKVMAQGSRPIMRQKNGILSGREIVIILDIKKTEYYEAKKKNRRNYRIMRQIKRVNEGNRILDLKKGFRID